MIAPKVNLCLKLAFKNVLGYRLNANLNGTVCKSIVNSIQLHFLITHTKIHG